MKDLIQRKLAIIEDAILQLKAQRYKTGDFGYVKLSESLKELQAEEPDSSAQNALLETQEVCGVCAKGALFLSTIRKENEFALGKIAGNHSEIITKLEEVFDRNNMHLVEAFYEDYNFSKYEFSSGWSVLGLYGGGFYFVASGGSGCSLEQAEERQNYLNRVRSQFIDKYPEGDNRDRTERLIAILENMLENEGVFKP